MSIIPNETRGAVARDGATQSQKKIAGQRPLRGAMRRTYKWPTRPAIRGVRKRTHLQEHCILY